MLLKDRRKITRSQKNKTRRKPIPAVGKRKKSLSPKKRKSLT
jgi:hypothetical protein